MLVPLVVALCGLGLYFATPAKLSELGRLLFFIGAFWLVHLFANGRLHLYGP